MTNRYIEANELVRILEREEEYLASEGLDERANGIRDATMDVLSAPSADVRENVHGEWIDWSRMGLDGTYVWHRACSKCGYERKDDDIDKDTNFCPDCGAAMRGNKQ